jgi:hypothetical protein
MGRFEPPVTPSTVWRKSVLKMLGFSDVGIFSRARFRAPGDEVYGRFPGIFRRSALLEPLISAVELAGFVSAFDFSTITSPDYVGL